jgi:tetratricopeptide (TPR) repeat protein
VLHPPAVFIGLRPVWAATLKRKTEVPLQIMKQLFPILLIILALTGYSQAQTDVLSAAQKLIDAKKYESAYLLLNNDDPNNEKPDVVLMKEDIVLNYFVSSMMHQAFALKDLKKNEDIMKYRGQTGTFSMFPFQVDSVLLKLIEAYPDNCKLYRGLAFYYNEVLNKYGGWLGDEEELGQNIIDNSKKSIDGGCADYATYHNMGLVLLMQEKTEQSIPYLEKATELAPDQADAHYNLAYAYLFTDQFDNALPHAKLALKLYKDKELKGDAARITGGILAEKRDYLNALKYYEMADKLIPNDFYNLSPLLRLYLVTGNQKAPSTAKKLFELAPENPSIYQAMTEAYQFAGREPELVRFYKSMLPKYVNNDVVFGNLHFYLGTLSLEHDKAAAKQYFLKAKEIFRHVFSDDHYVFGVIDAALEGL